MFLTWMMIGTVAILMAAHAGELLVGVLMSGWSTAVIFEVPRRSLEMGVVRS